MKFLTFMDIDILLIFKEIIIMMNNKLINFINLIIKIYFLRNLKL